jgi:hypothetical protein
MTKQIADESMQIARQMDDAGILIGPASLDIASRYIAAKLAEKDAEIARLSEIVSRYELGAGPDDWRNCPGECGPSCCGYHDVCRAALLERPDHD